MQIRNIFEAIQRWGDTEEFAGNFEPREAERNTTDLPGSREKIELMRKRLEAGEHLHHEQDRLTYDGSYPTAAERVPRSGVSMAWSNGTSIIRSE